MTLELVQLGLPGVAALVKVPVADNGREWVADEKDGAAVHLLVVVQLDLNIVEWACDAIVQIMKIIVTSNLFRIFRSKILLIFRLSEYFTCWLRGAFSPLSVVCPCVLTVTTIPDNWRNV